MATVTVSVATRGWHGRGAGAPNLSTTRAALPAKGGGRRGAAQTLSKRAGGNPIDIVQISSSARSNCDGL